MAYCPYGLTHVRVPIFGNKKGDITSLNQLGILGELFSEFAFALHHGAWSNDVGLGREYAEKVQPWLFETLN